MGVCVDRSVVSKVKQQYLQMILIIKAYAFSLFGLLESQLGNYNSFEGVLYCRPHFDQLFKRTGSLDKSFEGN